MMGQFLKARRRLVKLLNALYWRLPWRWREPMVDFGYLVAGPLFKGVGHYETWKRKRRGQAFLSGASGVRHGAALIDLKRVTPRAQHAGRIAIHAHVYYPDLAQEFASQIDRMPFAYELLISVPDEKARVICEQRFSGLKKCAQLKIVVVPNRGRDIAPFFVTFADELKTCDFVCHIHTKKSLYNSGKTNGWREYLIESLFGSEMRLRQIFGLFENDATIGMVYPQNFSLVPYMANTWLSNRGMGQAWFHRLGLGDIPKGYFHFPAGSMFWARTDALRPLFDAGLRLEDFQEEAGQTDATLAHCLERMLGAVPSATGYGLAILQDEQSPSWSPWRFDRFVARTIEYAAEKIEAPEIQLVIFDIFDTLLVRPLLDPESIKNVVAERAGELGRAYLQWRAGAESQAREKAGRDVGMAAIYKELALLSGLEGPAIEMLRALEEQVESASVKPRADTVRLFQRALAAGKRVALASDMYLSRAVVEQLLERNGISGWHEFHLSSETGMRKDTGAFYRHILAEKKLLPQQVLMIGDNEHADVQIPNDMGIAVLNVVRPVELARGMSRLGPIVDAAMRRKDLNEELALGMLVQRAFQPLFYERFDPASLVPATAASVGYTVVGPLLAAFAEWLAAAARREGTSRLYFLSREGKLLKHAYDRWTTVLPDAPESEYLVLSRRAMTVPMAAGIDDILAIARRGFFPNDAEKFLYYRYGLKLSDSQWEEIERNGLWKKDKVLAIHDERIEHIEPLLLFLAPLIVKQGEQERPALMRYLSQMGLTGDSRSAVVDVGYSGSIQKALNQLLPRPVHGYYMMTDRKIHAVSDSHGVIAQGAWHHGVVWDADAPLMLRQSFLLEKLLGSDDPQVMRYRVEGDAIRADCGALSEAEMRARTVRAEIRRGVDEYLTDALHIRSSIYPAFAPPLEHAASLFCAFIENMSFEEEKILNGLPLDDHYCGRGVS